jgi:regulator of replication initiation timing
MKNRRRMITFLLVFCTTVLFFLITRNVEKIKDLESLYNNHVSETTKSLKNMNLKISKVVSGNNSININNMKVLLSRIEAIEEANVKKDDNLTFELETLKTKLNILNQDGIEAN